MKKLKIAELEKKTIRNFENKETLKFACCGGAASTNEDACCKLDEEKKTNGESGCGCQTSDTTKIGSTCC